jgi:hypothetical protein
LVAKEKDAIAVENRKRTLAIGLFINFRALFFSVTFLEAMPRVAIGQAAAIEFSVL